MRGQILGVDGRSGRGVIAGSDGERYTFGREDWAQRGEPVIGATVDFEVEGRNALSLFPIVEPVNGATTALRPAPTQTLPHNDRNKVIAAVIALFLGTLGIHRFYLGRNGTGIVMLLLSITVLGLCITAPWAFIDAIRYLVMSDEEFAARYPRR